MFLDGLFKNVEIHTRAIVRWNFESLHAKRFNRLKNRKVGWALGRDHITRFTDCPQAKIQTLHCSTRDGDVLRQKTAAGYHGALCNLLEERKASRRHLICSAVCGIDAGYAADD